MIVVNNEFRDLDPEDWPRAGIKGNRAFARQLLLESQQYIGGTVTLRFPNKTPDGKPRFPVAVAWFKGDRDV